MKKFTDIIKESKESKDLSYTTIFGKKVSHQEEFKNRLRSGIMQILMDERGVSEKSFTRLDELQNEVKNKLSEEHYNYAETLYKDNKRINYIAELLYGKLFENLTIEYKGYDIIISKISLGHHLRIEKDGNYIMAIKGGVSTEEKAIEQGKIMIDKRLNRG